MFGHVAVGLGDIGAVVEPMQAEGQVSQARHHPRRDTRPGLTRVLLERDVSTPMEGIFYFPVTPDPGVQLPRAYLMGRQRGDQIYDLDGPLLAFQLPCFSGQLGCLQGVGELDAAGECGDLDPADAPAPVTGILLLVALRYLFLGQGLELFEELGLVAFHRHQEMGASCVEELRMASQRMQGVNGDDLAVQVT